jgi:hypothetical protein
MRVDVANSSARPFVRVACHSVSVPGLLWLRLAMAYQKEAPELCSSAGITNSMRACAAASLSRRCLAASLAHYSCFASRTASDSAVSSASPLGRCHAVALEAARSIVAKTLPQGHAGEMYVLPLGAGASAFEQQWLCGGAAAEAALQKVTSLQQS